MRIRNSAEIAALYEGSTISRPPVLYSMIVHNSTITVTSHTVSVTHAAQFSKTGQYHTVEHSYSCARLLHSRGHHTECSCSPVRVSLTSARTAWHPLQFRTAAWNSEEFRAFVVLYDTTTLGNRGSRPVNNGQLYPSRCENQLDALSSLLRLKAGVRKGITCHIDTDCEGKATRARHLSFYVQLYLYCKPIGA